MKHVPLALALTLPILAHASQPPAEIVITADRFATPSNLVHAPVVVITREDIERRQVASLGELIHVAAGLNVTTSGNLTGQTSAFIRGTPSKQTLVLIDGMRVNSATAGGFDFSTLAPQDVERIEIVRGAGSVQYGSDAIGGVIQIFTRQRRDNTLMLRAGSFGTVEGSAGTFHGDANAGAGITIGGLSTSGYNSYKPNPFFPTSTDRDGGQRKTVSINAYRVMERARLDLQAIGRDGQTDYDDGRIDQRFTSTTAKLSHDITGWWQQVISVGATRDGLQDRNAFAPSTFVSSRQTLSWLHQVNALGGRWTGGIEEIREQARNSGATGYRGDLENTGVYLQNLTQIQRLDVRTGMRHDRYSTFGSKTTGSASIGWRFTGQVDGYIKYATAYRAPGGNDLFYPGLPDTPGPFSCMATVCYAGNPALKPESSVQREVGLTWRLPNDHQLRMSAYRNDVTNLIQIDFSQPGFPIGNIAEAVLRGVELEASGQHGHWRYLASATRQLAENGQGQTLSPRRPGKLLNLDLNYRGWDRLTPGVEMLYRSTEAAQQTYTLWNSYVNWQATKALQLGLRVDNLTDVRYEPAGSSFPGFNTPGRSGYVTATYRF